jgi:hypothetical protein
VAPFFHKLQRFVQTAAQKEPPKETSNIPNFKIFTVFLSAFLLLEVFALPVFAIDYNVGVTKGQYVTYGNFVGEGPGVETFNDYNWSKLEVTAVSGKEVTLLSTGQYNNGAPIPGNGTIEVWNVEIGTESGVPSTQGPIIAANLNEGDSIPPPNTYSVNKTETRVYLGVSRSVNILAVTISTPDYSTSLTYVYDRSSGMLLESTVETTQNQPESVTSTYSYSIIDTNLFESASTIPISSVLIIFVIAAIAIIIVLVVAVFVIRKKAKR